MRKTEDKAASRHRTVGWQLTHVARLYRARIASGLAAVGLFPGQEQVLETLSGVETMTMSELAAGLRVRPPTASKTIGRLTLAGLVERRDGEGDGRIVRVALTAAGRDKLASIAAVIEQAETEMTTTLDGKDRKRLRKLLRRVEKSLAASGAGTAPGDEQGAEDADEA